MKTRHKNDCLKILYNNISSINGKEQELQLLVNEIQPHVVCLQETRSAKTLKLNGYTEAGSINPTKRQNGIRGSKILVKENITFSKMSIDQKENSEVLGVEIILPAQKPVRIIGVYLSPRNNACTQTKRAELLHGLLSHLRTNSPTFLVGDFNARLDIPHHTFTNKLGDELTELSNQGYIEIHLPGEFTRYDPAGRDPSVLDFAISAPNHMGMVNDTKVLNDIGSDHRPVLTQLLVGDITSKEIITPKPNFDEADWLKYQHVTERLMPGAPPIQETADGIDNAAAFIAELITKADSESIPRITIKPRAQGRNLPPSIVQLIRQKRKLRNRFQKRRWEYHLKPMINQLDREIKEAISRFEETRRTKMWDKSVEKNQYGFYKLARQYLGKPIKQRTYPIRKADGQFASTDEQRVQIFADLYTEIYSCPNSNPGNDNLNTDADNYALTLKATFGDVKARVGHDIDTTVSASNILKVLHRAKRTSPGTDGIFYTHIVNLPDCALDYLAKLYTTSIRCCYFPSAWKKGSTILIPKPGKDLQEPKNYRPITLLSALGKTLEKVINVGLVKILEMRNILPESQAGFRSKRSTQDQLFRLTQDISAAFQQNKVAMATMFDIEKAYDKVWHHGLILKLKQLGLSDPTIALIQNFLSDREIAIRIKDTESKPILLNAGMPQGAILSPTVFNAWVADIPQPEGLRTKISQYADDMASWVTDKTMEKAEMKLQRYNNRLVAWSKKWRIQLSPAKTTVIKFHRKHIRRKKKAPGQTIDGKRILAKDEVEFLGLLFDRRLTFKKQENKIMKELQRRTNMFASMTGSATKPRAPTHICLKIFQSMILPITTYGCSATCIRSEASFRKQDTVLRKAARLAIHCPRSTRNDYLKREIGLEDTKTLTTRMARKYITNDERSKSVKDEIRDFRNNDNTANPEIRAPLNVILSKQ